MTVHSGDRCGTDEFLAFIGGGGGETTQVVQTDHLQEWENNCRFLGIHQNRGGSLGGPLQNNLRVLRPLAPLSFIF